MFRFEVRRAVGTFGFALSLLLGVFWLSYRNTSVLLGSAELRGHTDEVIASNRAVLLDLVDAETGTRGFVATGDERFLEAYDAGRKRLPSDLARLRSLTTDNPRQQARLDRLEPLAEARFSHMAQTIALRREGAAQGELKMRLLEGKRLMDESRRLIQEMRDEERELMAERDRALKADTRRVNLTLLTGAALGACLLGVAFIALEREVRERKRAEAAAEARAEEIRDLFDNAPCGYHSVDSEGRFLRMNDTELRWLGYQRDEVVGKKTFVDLIPAESMDRSRSGLSELKERGVVRDLEFEMVRKDGTRLPVLISATAMRDEAGKFAASRSTVFDITERRRIEEERDRFFNLSQDLFFIGGVDGSIKRLNPAWERTLGHDVADLLSKPFMVLVHPDDVAATAAEMERLLAGHTVSGFENRYRHKNGSYRWFQWSGMADLDRGIIYGIARDVTAQREVQEEIRRAREAAETANMELEAFSYSVSHDLRQPLRSIDGFSLALLEDFGDTLPASARALLERVRAGAQRMAQLIDDLLDLSRISRAELALEPVDLSGLVGTVWQDVRSQDPSRDVSFKVADGIVGRADPRLLRVALGNLIGNAWKFTRKKPGARIEFGALEQNGQPVYFVRDDGAGFDMAYSAKLFGAFQRLHSAGDFEGTGIGLVTVARVVHRHGGRVWAEGAVEQGAAFFFTLGETREPARLEV